MSMFTVMKVIPSHPGWDEDEGDSEYEIAHFDDRQEAEDAAKAWEPPMGTPPTGHTDIACETTFRRIA